MTTHTDTLRARPTTSWFPVRHIAALHAGTLPLANVLDDAVRFGFTHIEIHGSTLVPQTTELLAERELSVSQITCAPDFTNPDPDTRRREHAHMLHMIDRATELACPNLRVTAGKAHPGVAAEGIRSAVEHLTSLADVAATVDVTLCLENHYRDRAWGVDELDFATDFAVFADLFHALEGSGVAINFDSGQPMVVGWDELELLALVLPRVHNLHVGDRRHGQRAHSVIGRGDSRLDAIMASLAGVGYGGFLTIEDGSDQGDPGTLESVAYVDGLIARHWGGVG
jgi:sugar phosphate isomerase/epimerase